MNTMQRSQVQELVRHVAQGLEKVRSIVDRSTGHGPRPKPETLEVPKLYAARVAQICRIDPRIVIVILPSTEARPNRVISIDWKKPKPKPKNGDGACVKTKNPPPPPPL